MSPHMGPRRLMYMGTKRLIWAHIWAQYVRLYVIRLEKGFMQVIRLEHVKALCNQAGWLAEAQRGPERPTEGSTHTHTHTRTHAHTHTPTHTHTHARTPGRSSACGNASGRLGEASEVLGIASGRLGESWGGLGKACAKCVGNDSEQLTDWEAACPNSAKKASKGPWSPQAKKN